MSPISLHPPCPTCGETAGFDQKTKDDVVEFTCRHCGTIWLFRQSDVPLVEESA